MRPATRYAVIFVCSCIAAIYLHEIGHALFGWVQGIGVVPSPAKEYVLRIQLEWRQMTWIALGGPLTTAVLAIAAILLAFRRKQNSDPVLAGILVVPGVYALRFLLIGRGHDGLEFQEAQTALGLSPSGHFFDFIFLALFTVGCVALILRSGIRTWNTLFNAIGLGSLGFVLLIAVQVANNALFDPWFPKTQTLHVPQGLSPR